MTLRCIKCHRKLTREPIDGMGPRCFAKAGKPAIPAHERDLFGFDIEKAATSASLRTRVLVNVLAAQARIDLRDAFAAARRRLGVWHG
jgi:hypothetical protein